MKPALLLFTDHFPYGTSEPFLSDELPYLSEAFATITIVPLDSSVHSVQRAIPENVNIFHSGITNYKNKIFLLGHGLFGKGSLKILLLDLVRSGAWRNIKKLIHWFTVALMIRSYLPVFNHLMKQTKNQQDTIAYFYWGQRWSQILPFIRHSFKKVIIRLHGSDLYEHLYQDYIPFREQQLEFADRIFTISATGESYLKKKYPQLARKIHLARLGSSDHGKNPESERQQNPFVVVSCAGLVKVKRIPLIPEILKHTTNPIYWYHFGDGPQMKELKKKSMELPKNITYNLMGHVNHEELLKFYATNHVDLFLNVSSSEGVPVSIMEALSFGIPVIATDVGGTGELIDETNGKLIPVDFSPLETGKILNTMLPDDTLIERRIAARRSWTKLADSSLVYPEFIKHLMMDFQLHPQVNKR
ncbi:MAG: glycosyltransferase [Bacteroidales bacterium]|nr:glycosyltransferase [Bacteroidales bacterium]